MQSLDCWEWERFWETWDRTVAAEPGHRQEMLDRIGTGMTAAVRSAITGSGLHDSRGLIALHQNPHRGSFGGYVAVRADSVEILAGGQRKTPINVGRLTNYLASGHRVRPPTGRSEGYRSRANMARVPGFAFYEKAAEQVRPIAKEEAETYLRHLTKELTT